MQTEHLDDLDICLASLNTYSNENKSNAVIRLLDSFFNSIDPKMVENSLQLLDREPVVLLRTKETNRCCYRVIGSHTISYVCFNNYCPCKSYQQNILKTPYGHIFCKHLLAIKIAPHLNRIEENIIEEEDFWKFITPGT